MAERKDPRAPNGNGNGNGDDGHHDAAPSKVERAKAASHQLRGTVSETLASGADHFEHDDVHVLKFHGIYQQDNRDSRVERRHAGEGKERSFMVRARIPGGTLTADQYLSLDDIAGRFSSTASLRLTSRQSIQLHGVGFGELRETIRELNDALVSTLAACGDVMRNVMGAPRTDRRRRSSRRARDRPRSRRGDGAAHRRVPRDLARRRAGRRRLRGWGDRALPRQAFRRQRRGAVLRRALPAAQVQDRGRAAERHRGRSPFAGRRARRHPRRRERRRAARGQRARGRRARHDAPQGRHLRAARQRDRLRARAARGRDREDHRRGLPRPRQSQRSPTRAPQVPARGLGRRALPRRAAASGIVRDPALGRPRNAAP